MFRRRNRLPSNATGKTKIRLDDMQLINIPPTQCLIFMKYKQGRTGSESRKYPISGNDVIFAEPLIFDYEMPHERHAHHPKPLRLSFRMENPSSSGFTRYGIVELDLMQYTLDGEFNVRVLLADCAYNTYFLAKLQLPEGPPFLTAASEAAVEDATGNSLADSIPMMRPRAGSLAASGSQGSSSSSSSTQLFERSPVPISRERFDQLEKQVDLMLAGIINADDDMAM
jgi:hypothetical protein